MEDIESGLITAQFPSVLGVIVLTNVLRPVQVYKINTYMYIHKSSTEFN